MYLSHVARTYKITCNLKSNHPLPTSVSSPSLCSSLSFADAAISLSLSLRTTCPSSTKAHMTLGYGGMYDYVDLNSDVIFKLHEVIGRDICIRWVLIRAYGLRTYSDTTFVRTPEA